MSKEDYTKLTSIAQNANNYIHPQTHPASMVVQDSTHRFVYDTEKSSWNDKYSKSEIDNKFSALETAIDWKESVNSFSDIAKTYPNPQDGWTVNVKDTDYTYRYSGSKWVAISANAIPKATSSVDGLMSKEDYTKLTSIAQNANNYTHPQTHPASMVVQDSTHRFITDSEKADINKIFVGTSFTDAVRTKILFKVV